MRNMPSGISTDSVVVAVSEQMTADLSGEAIILHLKTNNYYGLNAVGAGIWELVQSPVSVSEIRDRMLAMYNVLPGQCEQDLLALLGELASLGLIRVSNEPHI